MKNEVKYRIPERWTKPFHKEDILGIDPAKLNKDPDQLGLVNKAPTIKKRKEYSDREEQSIHKQLNGELPVVNPILSHSLS